MQLIYYCIFWTPLSLISVGAAGDVMQFWDIAVEAILKNILAVFLLFVPFVFLVLHRNKLVFREKKPPELSLVLALRDELLMLGRMCDTYGGRANFSEYVVFRGIRPSFQSTGWFVHHYPPRR